MAESYTDENAVTWGVVEDEIPIADAKKKYLTDATEGVDPDAPYPTITQEAAHEMKHVPIGEMTLRDHFASAVLNGFFASGLTPDDTDEGRSIVASRCYEMADAMILERDMDDYEDDEMPEEII